MQKLIKLSYITLIISFLSAINLLAFETVPGMANKAYAQTAHVAPKSDTGSTIIVYEESGLGVLTEVTLGKGKKPVIDSQKDGKARKDRPKKKRKMPECIKQIDDLYQTCVEAGLSPEKAIRVCCVNHAKR